MSTSTADPDRIVVRPPERTDPSAGPVLRMIDGKGLGVTEVASQAIPPTGYTFCFCTCVPPLEGDGQDGGGRV